VKKLERDRLRELVAAVEEERRWATGTQEHVHAADALYRLAEEFGAELVPENDGKTA
jgi:hypothetical protein